MKGPIKKRYKISYLLGSIISNFLLEYVFYCYCYADPPDKGPQWGSSSSDVKVSEKSAADSPSAVRRARRGAKNSKK